MTRFSDISSNQDLETEIAYFYGAKNPQSIITNYVAALKSLEDECHDEMLHHLELAYEAVICETPLNFDAAVTAQIEQKLILAQKNKAPFEEIETIHQQLYRTVFGVDNAAIYKASKLRAFLYQYKVSIHQNEETYTEGDIAVMRIIAKESAKLLSSCIKHIA